MSAKPNFLHSLVQIACPPGKEPLLHFRRQRSNNTEVVGECRDAETLVLYLTTIWHLMRIPLLQRKIKKKLIYHKISHLEQGSLDIHRNAFKVLFCDEL